MKRCAMVLLACAALAGLVSGRAVAAIPVKVASSVGTSEQNYVNVTYGKLVELAQKYSGGAFEFQLYPDMRLGDEQKTVRALQHGDIQMSVLATNNFMPFAPSCGWLNMPYLFGSLEEFRKLVDLMWDQHNAWAVKESGARVLAIVDIGYRQLTTDAAHPVRNLADVRGLAVRTPQNALAVSAFNALGFKPHPASFADTYGMLAKGTVNGQEGCFNNVVTMKFADHQKYATCINYAVHSANIIVNEEWLQGLPEQARDALSRFLDACETPYKKRSLRGSAFLCLGRDGLLNVLYTIPCCGCPGACLGAELGAVSVEAGSGMRPTARVRYSRVLLMCIKLQCISSWCPSALQQERLWNGYEAARHGNTGAASWVNGIRLL